MDIFIKNFVLFFAMIDPIGSTVVFLSLTSTHSEELKRRIAFKSVLTAAAILLFFVALGEIILIQFEIPIPAFQIAGGIIIFIFAISMVTGDHSQDPGESDSPLPKGTGIAIYPLAMPSIAGPGALLSCVILTENDKFNLLEQLITSAAMLCVLAILLVMLLNSKYISRVIGKSGAEIISRVMGLILASIAVAAIIQGLKAAFPELLSA